MSDVTVRQLAEVVGIPLERLLTQLGDAGLEVTSADDLLSDAEKLKLLSYLRQSHGKEQGEGTEPRKVTLQRRTVSELKQGKIPGKGVKTVSVEVRKKRTYIKRSELPESTERRLEAEKARHALEEQQREQESQEAMRLQREEALRQQAIQDEQKLRESAEMIEQQRLQEEMRKVAETITPEAEVPVIEIAKPEPAMAPPASSTRETAGRDRQGPPRRPHPGRLRRRLPR